ncbi:GNAT family N-acetyltransferase [Amycolatopsis saalfeldensis]|uniref:Ribosomal protein S18 acetylase RimI n=1 Tax=Amycolatopsis saalfeldensis TaxID=394193 RepID=A0A1H8YRS6_9PSEU|nr:GNAT family N-acetyltransferase [Amycolatopsis saalfeldensis]SEP54088.1 Ribosomal protein S18 acetylase RimI [Amycolatopsis saalfeldensis]
MKISPLTQHDIADVIELMSLGAPYIRPRTASDYWLYATLFSTTCPIARDGDHLVGAIMAFRSQDNPDDVYLQDVITHPEHRRAGVTTALLNAVRERSQLLGARRLYLTSEPDNTTAHTTWTRRGFTNVPGDQTIEGVSVISDYKGPGKHRAVYELLI